MANSNLKLQIITALDNAGIKATQDQLNNLNQTLGKVNDSGHMQGMQKSLVKMPGMFGKISESIGGVGTAIGSVFAAWKAFSEGVKIGHKIFEQFSDGAGYSLESIGNGFKDLGEKAMNWLSGVDVEKQMAEARKAEMEHQQAITNMVNQRANTVLKNTQDELAARNKILASIHDETQALIDRGKVQADLKNSSGDARILFFESAKNMLQKGYRQKGENDMAMQIGFYYDNLIQDYKAKQQTANHSQELRKLDAQIKEAQRTINQNSKTYTELGYEKNLAKGGMDKYYKYRGRPGADMQRYNKWKETYEKVAEEQEKAKKARDAAIEKRNLLLDQRNVLVQQGTNLAFQQAIDSKNVRQQWYDWWKDNYEEAWLAENAHAYNPEYRKYEEYLAMRKQEDDAFVDAADYMLRTAEASEGLAEKMDQLLQMKGY